MTSRLTSILCASLWVACGIIAACAPSQKGKPTQSLPLPSEISPASEDLYRQKRLDLVDLLIAEGAVSQPDVLRAMQTVPRHQFVTPDMIDQAYDNHPLPIGYGQTISQPYVVAWMTELLDLQPGEKVLEIGTGSGYQAAVLAELNGVEVYSVEIVPELAESASTRLQDLGYNQVKLKQGDGYFGWAEYAPFDAIIVTAAPDHLPAPLAAQLKAGGRLVIPIGPPGDQYLWKFVNENGELKAYNLGSVLFVEFTGEGVKGGATPTP
ncbi:MAG: protein-L-isoaspartate(D-aspartate) O-methyltransferase [Chloroflexi bacterium]|nr:protein-L-isoaspartate(D-aspartate) O-methyltransferase [Chloroflexota bacterium]